MATFKQRILLAVLLNAILFTTASTVTHFEREWNITLSDLTKEGETLGKDNIAAYAKCNNISNTQRECVVIYEFLHPEGFIFKNKCYSSFRHDKGINKLDMMKIRAAAEGKLVMSYVSEREGDVSKWATVYRVIDTSTCKYYESKVLLNISQLSEELGDRIFLNDDETFDTFLAQKDLCGGARCRVTFGSDGEMIRDPVFYLPDEMLAKDIKMFPLIKTSESSQFFAVVKNLNTTNSNQRNGPTALKLLYANAFFTSPETILDLSDVVAYDLDNSHGVLAICWSKSKDKNITAVECHQYKANNEKIVNASFELPSPMKTLKVKNTWGGEELLLLTEECENDLCENGGSYYIRAINRRKPHSGNMEISGLNCDGNKKEINISVFNKNSIDDKICVSVSCQNFVRKESGKSYNNVKLVRQCFLTKYIHESF